MEPTHSGIATLGANLREQGLAAAEGRYMPGLVAAAAPVPDSQGRFRRRPRLPESTGQPLAPVHRRSKACWPVAACGRSSALRIERYRQNTTIEIDQRKTRPLLRPLDQTDQ